MYAKVLKKRKYEPEWGSSKDSMFSTDHESSVASSFHSVPPTNVDSLKDTEDCDKHIDYDSNQATDEIDGVPGNECYATVPERKCVHVVF